MSAETKFTPGPWRKAMGGNMGNVIEAQSGKNYGTGDDGFRHVASYQACGDNARKYHEEWGNASANGSLIAAAPELYEALHNALVLVRALTGPDDAIAAATISAGEAALAKARGESTIPQTGS